MNLRSILEHAVQQHVSDIFIIAGRPVSYRKNGRLYMEDQEKLMPEDTQELVEAIYEMTDLHEEKTLLQTGDDDFSVAIPGLARFRINTFMQRGSLSAVIRVITYPLPDPNKIGIPPYIITLAESGKGLILVTGPAGSGKSTTLACMIDHLNQTQEKHIITLEDPIEYLHRHNRSIVSQREINIDTESYVAALRAALRQSPDVIQLGEMRDYETIEIAMTAAETGHMVLSTLHTIGAANTIDRIIDVFPANQQRQIAVQLSMTLQAVISQQLVPSVSGDMIPVFEIMTVNTAIRNMIRDGKVAQIEGQLYSSARDDMISMDSALMKLCKAGKITRSTALTYATNPDMLSKKI